MPAHHSLLIAYRPSRPTAVEGICGPAASKSLRRGISLESETLVWLDQDEELHRAFMGGPVLALSGLVWSQQGPLSSRGGNGMAMPISQFSICQDSGEVSFSTPREKNTDDDEMGFSTNSFSRSCRTIFLLLLLHPEMRPGLPLNNGIFRRDSRPSERLVGDDFCPAYPPHSASTTPPLDPHRLVQGSCH